MADERSFRVIVDLSAFFYDHRRVARVFVKKNINTIADLQNRISNVFNINEFYLTTGGHFLPASEDVRILSNNENVCVIPIKKEENVEQSNKKVTSSIQIIEHKKQKKLDIIPEGYNVEYISKKKKGKKKSAETKSSEDEIPPKKKKFNHHEVSSDDEKNYKKKNKQKGKTYTKDLSIGLENEAVKSGKQKESIVERQICNIESSQKILDIKKKLKQQTEDYIKKHANTSTNSIESSSDLKNVLPKLQSHIKSCNDLGRSNLPETVRLSRHSDTPIKTFTMYTPPPRITEKYLAKNRINIVKIDIVKSEGEEFIGNVNRSYCDNHSSSDTSRQNLTESNSSQDVAASISPQKNYVKEVVSTFEKIISPESEKKIDTKIEKIEQDTLTNKVTEASNYTKAFLDKKTHDFSDNSEDKTEMDTQDIDPPKENLLTKSITKDEKVDTNQCHENTSNDDFVNVPKKECNEYQNDQNTAVDIVCVPLKEETSNGAEEGASCSALVNHETSDVKEDLENTSDLQNNSSFTQESFYSSNPFDSSLNSTNTSINLNSSSLKGTPLNKKYSGIGSLLEQLRESDTLLSQESDVSGQFVTKRKRIRKHRKKNKKSGDSQEPQDFKRESSVIKPMNVSACPSIHIKFEENEVEMSADGSMTKDKHDCNDDKKNEGNEITVDVDKQLYNETEKQDHVLETMILSDEDDDAIMENKSIFGEDNISRAPLMNSKLAPKVGDIIAFKILKISENYTPILSNYIVGKLENFISDKQIANFKILYRDGELETPIGKLYTDEKAANQTTKYREIPWRDVISPKLLYP